MAKEVLHVRTERNKQQMAFMVKTVLDAAVRSSLSRSAQAACLTLFDAIIKATPGHDAFLPFFPGITTALLSLIIADYKLGSPLRVQALALWTSVVVQVLGDIHNNHLLLEDHVEKEEASSNASLATFQQWSARHEPKRSSAGSKKAATEYINPMRDREWIIATVIRVHQALEAVCKRCRSSTSINVRKEIIRSAGALLLGCIRVFGLSISPSVLAQHGPFAAGTVSALLLDVVMSGLEDDHHIVACCASEIIRDIEHGFSQMPENPWEKIQAGLGHALYTKIRSLPRLARAANEREMVVAMNSCCAHIRMLGGRCRTVFEVSFSRTVNCILQAFELSTYAQESVVQFNVVKNTTIGYPSKIYEHIKDPPTIRAYSKFARCLGSAFSSMCSQLFEALLNTFAIHDDPTLGEQLAVSPRLLPELLNLVNEAVLGATNSDEVNALMDVYLDLPALQSDYSIEPAKQLVDYKTERWLVAMSLEGLGNWAEAARLCGMESKQLRKRLVKLLFPVLQHIGDRNALVHCSSVATLQRFAILCEYESVPDLLKGNLDYILDSVLQRLDHVELFPTMPHVVEATMKYAEIHVSDASGESALIMPFIIDLVAKLRQSLETHRNGATQTVYRLLRALGSILVVFPTAESKPTDVRTPRSPLERLADELSTWKKVNDSDELVGESMGEDGRDPGEEEREGTDEEVEKEKDPCEEMAQQILSCAHQYSLQEEAIVRRQVMVILSTGFTVLSQSEDTLLPLIHKVWPTMIATLNREHNLALVATTVGTIATSINCAGGFMERRFIDTALSPMLGALSKSYEASSSKSVDLVSAILDCLTLAMDTLPGMRTLEKIEKVVKAAGRFLGDVHPEGVSEAAIRLFTALCRKNPAVMWLEVIPYVVKVKDHALALPFVAPCKQFVQIDTLPEPRFLVQMPNSEALSSLVNTLEQCKPIY